MNILELKEQIRDVPDDVKVFMRCCVNPCGNIMEVMTAGKDTCVFFGQSIDCIIMEPDIDE